MSEIFPTGSIINISSAIRQDILSLNVQFQMSCIIVGMRTFLSSFQLYTLKMKITVIFFPAGSHYIDSSLFICIIFLFRSCSFFACCYEIKIFFFPCDLIHCPEICPHFIQILGIKCQIHSFIKRRVTASGS